VVGGEGVEDMGEWTVDDFVFDEFLRGDGGC
jgi:hypothetical protein